MSSDYDYYSDSPGKKGPDSPYPMKWFKFMIYFAMFAGALIELISGIKLLTGSTYGDSYTRELVYAWYSGLKTVDILFGIVFIAIAGLIIYARFRLAGFYSNGPQMFLIAYSADIVASVLYIIAVMAVTGISYSELNPTSITSSIVTAVVMLIVNKIYLGKRASLFVN